LKRLFSQQGGFMTNMDDGAANTVTWGVFPGKEIVQPTIIEEVSFLAWKVLPVMRV
jgi:methylenetetrahydrofolate reductase (NADPH)